MKPFFLTVMIICMASSALASDVAVSVSVGQPGFYGRIDIGNAPRPELIYTQPIVVHPVPAGVAYRPVYMHVPPGHAEHWGNHCQRYNACGRPVYFVRDRWYNDVYVPHYAKHGGKKHKDKQYKEKKGKKDKKDGGKGRGHGGRDH